MEMSYNGDPLMRYVGEKLRDFKLSVSTGNLWYGGLKLIGMRIKH